MLGSRKRGTPKEYRDSIRLRGIPVSIVTRSGVAGDESRFAPAKIAEAPATRVEGLRAGRSRRLAPRASFEAKVQWACATLDTSRNEPGLRDSPLRCVSLNPSHARGWFGDGAIPTACASG